MREEMTKNQVRRILWGSLFLLAQLSSVTGAAVVSRPVDESGGLGFFSHTPPAVDVRESADDFTIGTDVQITQVDWYGWYFRSRDSTSTNFLIRFYADAGGIPDAAPFFESAVEASVENAGFVRDESTAYSYSAPLSIELTPGEYWIAILESDPTTNSNNEIWTWAPSTAGTDTAQRTTGDWLVYDVPTWGDRAFSLVPEASSITLAIVGVLGLYSNLLWNRRML